VARIPGIVSVKRSDAIMLPLAAAQTFLTGAFVLRDGSGNIAECGADPASIYGLSMEPAGKEPTDAVNKVLVQQCTEMTRFWMPCSAAPVAANSGINYGITKGADGYWYVDFAKTAGTARVYVHQVDTDTARVEISVLAANRQSAP
jgi:hypothetical protein